MKWKMLFIALIIVLMNSCAVIRPGEVGIKQRLGILSKEVITEGMVSFNPFTTRVIKQSTQTQNIRLKLNLPSKEGLSVRSEISILYRLEEQMVASILENMKIILEKQADGIDLISVLMKSIRLPEGLANSIERKLQAEQDAMRMEFVLNQERKEAERKIISAKGERDAQIIISEGLTDGIIKIKSIDAFRQLSKSANTKIIITDGQTPIIISDDVDQ